MRERLIDLITSFGELFLQKENKAKIRQNVYLDVGNRYILFAKRGSELNIERANEIYRMRNSLYFGDAQWYALIVKKKYHI